jgi:hypothetical protein
MIDMRVEPLAAFLYGLNWTPGRQPFLSQPHAVRRQWIETAKAALDVIDEHTSPNNESL